MRTLLFAALAAALATGAPPAAFGQPGGAGELPVIFFSDDPELKAEPDRPIRTLPLRPNAEQTTFVYVSNRTAIDRTFKVFLKSTRKVAGRDLTETTAEATVAVGSRKVERVRFKPLGAAPAPASAGAAPAPAPASALFEAPSFTLEMQDRAGPKVVDTDALVKLEIPSSYVRVKAAVRGRVLSVAVERVPEVLFGPTAPPAVPLRLSLLGAPGFPLPAAAFQTEGNSLEGQLGMAAGDAAAVLIASLPADARTALLAVDGVEGAFRFDLPDGDADDLKASEATILLPICPPAVVSGAPLPVAALVTGDAEGEARIVFERVRESAAGPGHLEVRRFPTARDTAKALRVGESGEVIFVTRSRLWAVEIPTAGVFGVRKLHVGLADRKGPDVDVAIDATPPRLVGAIEGKAFARPTAAAAKLKLRLTARVTDPESGIDLTQGVLFFLGDPPAVKGRLIDAVPAAGSLVQLAEFDPKDGRAPAATYDPLTQTATASAEFDLPANLAASVRVGVLSANRAGQVGLGEFKIDTESLVPPVVTVLEVLPSKKPKEPYRPGEKVLVFASTASQLRDIDPLQPVWFYVGDAPLPDGTPAPGSDAYEGVPRADPTGRFNVYAAEFNLPKVLDREELKVWVRFVAKSGLPAVESVTILVRPSNGGTIKVKVVKGGETLQPGVPVYLTDGNGRLIGTGVTDNCGIAKFEELPPGLYSVTAVKPEDGNANASATTLVRAGQTVEATLNIKR